MSTGDLDEANVGFRKLAAGDFGLIHMWLNTDFVQRWYGKRAYSYQEVEEKYARYLNREKPTNAFLITYSGHPIGYIQTYRIGDYPDYARHVQVEEGAWGVDLFIGDREYIHRGLGAIILGRFLRETVFASPGVTSCVVGPEPENLAAIRVYEKVGFEYLKTVELQDEDEPEHLMRITRVELDARRPQR
jgi:RimJ/RimL family protein N-acetyltransferase